MRVVIDIETDKLINPSKIWCAVCKNIDTGEYHVFKNVEEHPSELKDFLSSADTVVGHFLLSFDLQVLSSLCSIQVPTDKVIDTLVVGKMADYSRVGGHSIANYGIEFGLKKIDFTDFTRYSKELETYCARDVDICEAIYRKYSDYIKSYSSAIALEQRFQQIVDELHVNGFAFDKEKAGKILSSVQEELDVLDREIDRAFPARLKLIREITPKYTQYGTLNRSDFRWVKDGNLSEFNGGAFCRCEWHPFNPASHKQVIEVLHAAKWLPTDKTETHKDIERDYNRLKYNRYRNEEEDIRLEEINRRLSGIQHYGWKINENNLSTLPSSAPAPARLLARRILYESRRRTLTEWLNLVTPEGRIHGEFQGIGAWTHRMAHQKPNMANIPNEFNNATGAVKLLGKELRSCWGAPRKRLLVGVDAEGIQFRVAAHYINDKALIKRLVDGKKSDKTDPHSFNKSLLGRVCKTRQAAKQFLFSTFLGAGITKLAVILDATQGDAEEALVRLLKEYPGIDYIKREVAPTDAKRGFFIGLDGRKVQIPGDTVGERKHLAPSGYLQNGEAIIIKRAAVIFNERLREQDSFLVDIVHDEYQIETPEDKTIALSVAQMVADAIKEAGEYYKLNCPMAGSYWNDDKKDYTIGANWYATH